jgi:hypothetical protein
MTFRALEKIANNLSAHDRGGKGGVVPRNLPLLALFLYFIAQVEDDLPVLASQVLIRRFYYLVEERDEDQSRRERTSASIHVPTISS